MYVFDSGPISALFRNYYPKTFKSLWLNFDRLVEAGKIVSTREVLREISDGSSESMRDWASDKAHLFSSPSAAEATFVAKIYGIAHFQQNIEKQKLLKGGKLADPFVIAKAAVENKTVVTMELFKANGAKMPNICQHFGVKCFTLADFMEEQDWSF